MLSYPVGVLTAALPAAVTGLLAPGLGWPVIQPRRCPRPSHCDLAFSAPRRIAYECEVFAVSFAHSPVFNLILRLITSLSQIT